ncbi:MAG: polyphenol oxidase family protein [Actinomycetota bacterium]
MIFGTQPTDRLPDAGAGFVWDEVGDERPVPVLRPIVDGIQAAFTTRVGGVSPRPYDELNISFRVGDRDDHARANRAIAGRAVGRDGSWSVVKQVHGAQVVRAGRPGNPLDADALWTDDAGQTLAVMAADCIPALVAAPGRLGLAHAGWRGLVEGVVEAAVGAVGSAPAVFAGPAIGPCCYVVGDDVREGFRSRFGTAVLASGDRLDLWAAAERAALEAGASSFSAARICTSCHPELFFSHRRDNGRTGRQALVAALS